MAEAVDYKGSPSFKEETDEDRCVQILATFGLDLSVAVASPPVDRDSTDPAAPSPPLGADLVRPAPPAPLHLSGVGWKLVNLPFYVIVGGMDFVLVSLRLGARAFNGALTFMDFFSPPGHLHKPSSDDATASGAVGTKATHLSPDILLGLASCLGPPRRIVQHKVSSDAGTASDAVGTNATHLPPDVLLEIADRLGPPRRNVQAMRSTCPAWRAGVPNTNGPLLLMSRLDQELPVGTQKLLALILVAPEGGATSLVHCPRFFRTPANAALWGAAHGLLALQHEGTSNLYLSCLNCGRYNVRLPRLPAGFTTGSAPWGDGITSGGIFFDELPTTPLAILFSRLPIMFTDQFVHAGRRWWDCYPGLEKTPMRSIGFLNETHFVGISDLTVVVGPIEVGYPGGKHYPGLKFLKEKLVFLDIPAEEAPVMVPWGKYGNHVFTCGERVYVCVMLRSVSDEDVVSSTIYSLDRLPGGGFALVRTYDIGDFAVYLGANQALVLPAAGSMNQLGNTIYIADDDGVSSTARVWAVNNASGETNSIPFPPGVQLSHYGRATWAAAPPLNMPFWHCDTMMGF